MELKLNKSEIFTQAWARVKSLGENISTALKAVWAKIKKNVMETINFAELSLEQLSALKSKIEEAIIAKTEKPKVEKVLFDPAEEFERYNGGWTKEVVGLDKTQTNGYSIKGGFTTSGKKDWYRVGKLYLDCGIGGSRKNQTKYYTLFTLEENGEVSTLATSKGNDWAVSLWEEIEKYLTK